MLSHSVIYKALALIQMLQVIVFVIRDFDVALIDVGKEGIDEDHAQFHLA